MRRADQSGVPQQALTRPALGRTVTADISEWDCARTMRPVLRVKRTSNRPIAKAKLIRSRGGVLATADAMQVLHQAETNIHAATQARMGEAERVAIAASESALRDLRTRAGAEDPNVDLIAWTLAQLLLVKFKDSLDPAHGQESVALLESCHGDWIDTSSRLYEVARAHYEVGRRIDDLVLLERAAALYDSAAERGRRISPRTRRTRKNAAEARDVAGNIRIRRVVPSGVPVTPVIVPVPMISIALENDCVHIPKRRGKSDPKYFHASTAGRAFLVRFVPSEDDDPLDQLFSPPRDVEHRGRSVMGRVQYAIALHGQRSNVAMLEFAIPGDAAAAEQFIKDNFDAVEGWGLRFSKWFDIVYPQEPLHGVTNVTRSLSVCVGAGRSAKTAIVLAPDAQSHVMVNTIALDRPTRIDVQRVIDQLADLEVPVALDFIRRARATIGAGDLLRALLECGTAAEAAIAAQYDWLAPTPHGPRWTLGTLISEAAKIRGALPSELPKEKLNAELVQVRNRAVHSGHTTRHRAESALELAEQIVAYVYGTDSDDDDVDNDGEVEDLRNKVLLLHP